MIYDISVFDIGLMICVIINFYNIYIHLEEHNIGIK